MMLPLQYSRSLTTFNIAGVASLHASKNDSSSLDYRLRDKPTVRESICDLLDGLIEEIEKFQTGE